MKNVNGFVRKSMPQPDHYELIFNGWCAVYKVGNKEYHLQLNVDYNTGNARNISLLRRDENHRIELSTYNTIKSAVQALERIANSAEAAPCITTR